MSKYNMMVHGMALALGFTTVVSTLVLVQIMEVAQKAPRALVCFNAQGQVTIGNGWKECHRVILLPMSKGAK